MKDTDNQLQQKDIDYLAKEVSELKVSMTAGFILVHNKLDIFNENYVKRIELDLILKSRDEKIGELMSNQKWLVRTIIGLVILAVMGLILTNK